MPFVLVCSGACHDDVLVARINAQDLEEQLEVYCTIPCIPRCASDIDTLIDQGCRSGDGSKILSDRLGARETAHGNAMIHCVFLLAQRGHAALPALGECLVRLATFSVALSARSYLLARALRAL